MKFLKYFFSFFLIFQISVASEKEIQDKAKGAFVGLAAGDALGTTLEFKERDSYPHLTDIVGGGPFKLKPGQWTDDTSMALCLADSLIEKQGFDPKDLMERFYRWWRTGYNSSTGECFDIGITTRQSLEEFKRTGNPYAGSKDPKKAGNGSIMRLAPVVLFHVDSLSKAQELARNQSRTTHQSEESIEAAALLATILFKAIHGEDPFDLSDFESTNQVVTDLAQSQGDWNWRKKSRSDIKSSGYVIHTLEAAMWSVANTTSFEEAVLMAANLGDDADTVGAVAGQIAGALYGLKNIPEKWRKILTDYDHFLHLSDKLLAHRHDPRPEHQNM